MSVKKTAYELTQSQVRTSPFIIKFYWELMSKYRPFFDKVLDLGAGDGRFAIGGHYSQYEGIEIDKSWSPRPQLPQNALLRYGCAFKDEIKDYDACIGNPPYVRHHNIGTRWRDKIADKIKNELNINLNKQCNLFAYFICLGIIKTKKDGIISFIVPYEWVSRPSTNFLREYLKQQNWTVDIYRFKESIFGKVETTSSIVIIDKGEKKNSNKWKFYDIDSEFNIKRKKNMVSSNSLFLRHENRGELWALRGLSPGTQKVFTLTEKERKKEGLTLRDVVPCVSTFKDVPYNLDLLNEITFKKYLIDQDKKCWLICSYKTMSNQLKKYLKRTPKEDRDTATCNIRRPWYKFKCYPPLEILYNSGFTVYGPRFLVNTIQAIAVGSIHGIHINQEVKAERLRDYLTQIDFEKRVVPHSGALKKIEVRQMNTILNSYWNEYKNG